MRPNNAIRHGLFMLLLAAAAGSCTAQSAKGAATNSTPPNCPYGYFDFAPYDCAPYGYYGPTWFKSGVFIGTGPWFRGSKHFRGQVDDHFDPRKGYDGEMPHSGDQRDQGRRTDEIENFHATEERDGRGHEYREHSH